MLKRFAARPFVDCALVVAALASAALLAGAHLFQLFGYAPCELCLDQREAHWTALGIAAAALALSFGARARRAAAAGAGALALVYLISAGLAGYHAGVEHGFWPGPATCSGGGAVEIDAQSLGAALDAGAPPPSCDAAAWRLFGVSMAGYNMLASAALSGVTALASFGFWRQARSDRRRGYGKGAA
jgi:disulfide bond formation protein DsbB